MDSAVKTRRSTQESFELQQLEFNAQMAGILDEGMLRDSCSLQQDRDLIFEEGEEEGGDHSVGPDFECNGIEVIWLANNELNNASADRESEVFYPTVHVGANETATVIGTKICRTGSPTSPDDLNNNGVDPNQQSPILPQTSLDGQHRPEPSQIETRFEEKQVHATTSEAFTVFSEANIKEQQHTRSSNLWMSKLQEADVSVSSATTFSADQLDHPNTYMEDSQSFNAQFSGECSPLVGNGKSEPERKLVGGYVLPQNNFQLSMSNFHQNGAIASNSNHLLPQQQNYGFTNSANTYLTYAIMPNNQISQNVLPVYMNDGLSYNQAFNISNNCDVNANVFSYNMGQHRQSEQNVTQLEISSSLGSPSTFEANREGIAENSCHDFVPLHQTMCTYSSSIGTLPTSSFFNQLSTDSSCQHYTSSITTNKPCVNNNMGILLQPKSQYRSTCRKGNQDLTTSFQMPFLPTYSQLNNGSDLVEDRNVCVTSSNQSDCSPPVLIPSTLTVQDPQDGDIDGFVPLTPQASLLQCSRSASQEFAGFSLPSAVVPTVVKSLEEVAVFKTPHRIGEALVKHAYYSRKIPQTIDVLVRNSVKNFEMTTTLSTKLPLNSLHSQSKFSNENLSKKDQLRAQSYLPIPRFPNMVDVNFRRCQGTRRLSRRRHLCEQTREVIGRVCAYFREFSKRYSALGNNIAGTPFENPERMASHATGFTIPTIRRCGERMEAVPSCTFRRGSVPTDEELSNLSLTFAEEPWCHGSKGRTRPVSTMRRKPRKRSTPSIVSISEAEESIDENIIDDHLEPDGEEENESGVPKRRRSQRILNQRRAKLLNRLRAKNHERKVFCTSKIDDEKKPNSEECVNTYAAVNSGDQSNDCVMVPKFPKKSELRKRRCQANFLKLGCLDSENNNEVRPTVKRSRSTTRISVSKSTNGVEKDDVEIPAHNSNTSATLMDSTDLTVVVDLRAAPEEFETTEIVVMS